MTVSTVTISAVEYDVYADIAYADLYLAGDMARAENWAALSDETKAVALVSSTRLLQRQNWIAGSPPPLDSPPEVVAQVCSMLAADIAVKPTLGDVAAPGSNIRGIGAGSVRVDFFAPVAAQALPTACLALLVGLIGSPISDDPSFDNASFGSNDCQTSRFDRTDFRQVGDSSPIVDIDELW